MLHIKSNPSLMFNTTAQSQKGVNPVLKYGLKPFWLQTEMFDMIGITNTLINLEQNKNVGT